MKLFWTAQALLKLQEIHFYIEKQASKKTAESFIEKLVERSETLTAFPKMGRVVPEINSSHIRELIEGNYRIVYHVSHKKIEVLTIFEGRKLLERRDVKQEK